MRNTELNHFFSHTHSRGTLITAQATLMHLTVSLNQSWNYLTLRQSKPNCQTMPSSNWLPNQQQTTKLSAQQPSRKQAELRLHSLIVTKAKPAGVGDLHGQ